MRTSCCQHVHFFAPPAAARRWRATHETGHVVSVAEAYFIARRIRALRGVLTEAS
ncbi:MAG: organomercurial lyase [Gemmatimonadales bacterium]